MRLDKLRTEVGPLSDDVPEVPQDLLEYLEKRWPPYVPQIGVSEQRLWHEVGIRSLIQKLRQMYSEQHQPPE